MGEGADSGHRSEAFVRRLKGATTLCDSNSIEASVGIGIGMSTSAFGMVTLDSAVLGCPASAICGFFARLQQRREVLGSFWFCHRRELQLDQPLAPVRPTFIAVLAALLPPA